MRRETHVDICETRDGLQLWADVPGIDEKSIDLQLDRGVLTIKGRVPEASDAGELRWGEYEPAGFERSFRLSDEIDSARIEARVVDGVLELRLPKAEHAKPRRIEVQQG